MFLGSGTLIETVEARVKSLERVLKDYIAKKFTGYVVLRNDVQGIYISIAIVEGHLAACRSIESGRMYEGVECCRIVMNHLYEPEGVIEVQDVPYNLIILDTTIFPLSKVERSTTLSSVLGAEVGMPRVVAPPSPPVTPPPPAIMPAIPPIRKEEVKVEEIGVEKPKEELPPPQPTTPPPSVVVPPPPAPPAPEKLAEISISKECIDPVTLYMVIKSGQLLESLTTPLLFKELIEKVRNIINEKKPGYIYLSSELEKATLKLIYDSQSNNISIEIEKEGATICGDNARKELENKLISNIKIWYVV
ncbi:MAG: hypothetical protein QW775_03720 [Ignisphaera sp.]|uniref:Uncharacterized protein n=1 Tax=Ignisphaera aggregans TaxID=334771 RepID=A0A7C4JJD0_9CREN